MGINYKDSIEMSLWDIAFARHGVRLNGGDVTDIDEFIATRGREIFEEVDAMNQFEAMAKMLELMLTTGKGEK